MVEEVRRHQAGNRTFGDELAGIASDLRHWEHPGERYQAWIDGGLFAMSFGDEHLVIVLVGFGHLPERLKVCRSPRLPMAAAYTLNAKLAGGRRESETTTTTDVTS